MKTNIRIVPGPMALAHAAAAEVQRIARHSIDQRGAFRIALAGGSTPRALYGWLANTDVESKLDFARWHVFFGDERCVPKDHADSNYRMANEALLSKVPIPSAQVHRVRTEDGDPVAVAAAYESEIRRSFALVKGDLPRFDLVLLGMGSDGHTASLFPGTRALAEVEKLAVANHVEKLGAFRITLTIPVINAAGQVMFLVAGADKADVLARVIEGDHPIARYPARAVRPVDGELTWMIDDAAAAALSTRRRAGFGLPRA